MTRTLPGYPNVLTMYPAEAAFTARKITPANYATARTEAPMAVDVQPDRIEAPQWQWRDENGRIIRDQFQPLKSQREIDDADGLPSTAALVVMFAAAAAVALIMAGFDWLVGVV